MKQFRKILALLLAVCALCSLMTGCGLLKDMSDLQEALEQKEQENQADFGDDWDVDDILPDDTQPVEDTQPATEQPETTEPPTEAATQPVSYNQFYQFWDYENEYFAESNVATYQDVTGVPCALSSYDWGFLEENYEDMVEGYDEFRGVFIYEYDWSSLNSYMEYLESIGFTSYLVEEYTQGTSYYYEDKATGYYLDIFVVSDQSYVAIEPYLNADPS